MFYSHTFLARKGPLGTVWCAAHLQHKLKKSHYTATDIPSTVERIMYPEVPIALRMSGHLLLGVVRIYSKKVDYLYQDCNVVLIGIRKAFPFAEVNLPEDATHAPFHSITLPDTFNLDALDLDEDIYPKGFHNEHLKRFDEITLTDQIPVGNDPYVVISFNEDASHSEDASGSGAVPMEEDSRPSILVDPTSGFQGAGPSNQAAVNGKSNEENIPQDVPAREILLDATHDFQFENVNDIIEPDRDLEQMVMKGKENDTPVIEEMLESGGRSIPSQQHQELSPVASEQALGNTDSRISFGHASPIIAMLPSPDIAMLPSPLVEQQPKARRRKRKQQFDETTVLSNKFMKKALENTSDILRMRKDRACSSLGVWKLNNRSKKDKIFLEPLMSGLSADLCNIYNKDFISVKNRHLVHSEEACPEPSEAPSSAHVGDLDTEIEGLRNYEGTAGSNVFPEDLHSPSSYVPSSTRSDFFTPAYDTTESRLSDMAETTTGTGIGPTPDPATSTESRGSEMETPTTFFNKQRLSGIPELVNSVEEELTFLEEDDNTPDGTPEVDFNLRNNNGTPELDALSARTRAVAQFLKRKSVTPTSEDPSGNLSLKTILEGKRRKSCARMIFETLVLKNCGLVDLEQEEPYGDITLKVTPKLFKEQLSS